jgi:uncharacterized protein YheU (UPF0270 family)
LAEDRSVLIETSSEVYELGRVLGEGSRDGAPESLEVRCVADDGVRLEGTDMGRDERLTVEDAHLSIADQHGDAIANEAMWDAVADRVDIDERVVGDTSL